LSSMQSTAEVVVRLRKLGRELDRLLEVPDSEIHAALSGVNDSPRIECRCKGGIASQGFCHFGLGLGDTPLVRVKPTEIIVRLGIYRPRPYGVLIFRCRFA